MSPLFILTFPVFLFAYNVSQHEVAHTSPDSTTASVNIGQMVIQPSTPPTTITEDAEDPEYESSGVLGKYYEVLTDHKGRPEGHPDYDTHTDPYNQGSIFILKSDCEGGYNPFTDPTLGNPQP